jgi:ERCC4-related helicase
MSERTELSWFYITEYQKAFIQKFLDFNSPPNHILFAPIGTGKTATSFAVVNEMVKLGSSRILILIPSTALIYQYKDLLSGLGKAINITVLDRKFVRENDTFSKNEPFAEKLIAISPIQQASHEEIAENILSVQWDLIILDDVDHITANSKQAVFLKALVERQASRRILILSNKTRAMIFRTQRSFLNNKLFENFEITQWRQKDIFPFGDMRPIRYSAIFFTRTEEEIHFIKKYISLSKWLSNKKFQNRIRSRLASSSLYAAEESLRTLRNRLVHGEFSSLLESNTFDKEFTGDEELLGDINSAEIDKKLSSKNLPKLMTEISDALDLLDRIQVDSKFNALLQAIQGMETIKRRTWIYASYKSTISYLHSSLKEFAPSIFQIHGQMSSFNVTENIQRFRNDGGILISSTSRLSNVNLRLDNLIMYDTPESETLIYKILSQLTRPSIGNVDLPANFFVLSDTTDALVAEQVRFRKLRGALEQLVQEEM